MCWLLIVESAQNVQVFAWVLNDFVLAWVHDQAPLDIRPLPDLSFRFLPEITAVMRVAEIIMLVLTIRYIPKVCFDSLFYSSFMFEWSGSHVASSTSLDRDQTCSFHHRHMLHISRLLHCAHSGLFLEYEHSV